jgi:hypothetical protein
MGPVLLPSEPGLKTDSPSMLDWGGPLTPSNGGAVQTLMRLGTRHSLDFTLPMMRTEPDGRKWAAQLRLAKLYGALLPFGQDGFTNRLLGAPVVDGAGQAGSTLALRGADPRGSVARLGQAFSLVHGGRRYLHFVAAEATAGADGRMSVPIFPMLRVIPDDGDVLEFARPMIQGNLSGQAVKWTRQTAPWTDLGTITITEAE